MREVYVFTAERTVQALEDGRRKRSGELNTSEEQPTRSVVRQKPVPSKGGAPAIPLEEMQLFSKKRELRVLHRNAEASDPDMQEGLCLHCGENTALWKMAETGDQKERGVKKCESKKM